MSHLCLLEPFPSSGLKQRFSRSSRLLSGFNRQHPTALIGHVPSLGESSPSLVLQGDHSLCCSDRLRGLQMLGLLLPLLQQECAAIFVAPNCKAHGRLVRPSSNPLTQPRGINPKTGKPVALKISGLPKSGSKTAAEPHFH